MKNTLYHNKYEEVLPLINDASIDCIICDLPYNTTKCKWDTPIDLEWLWKQYKRIIKPNGAILLFAQTPFDKTLGCSNIKWLKYEWIWEKTHATGSLNAKKNPMKAHENILVFYKKFPTYNFIKSTGHKPTNSFTKRMDVVNKTELYGKVKQDISGGGDTERYPRSVLKYSSDKQKNKLNGTIHPTQKPLALLEYFVSTYTNPGDLILDNCMGSGTTCVAAKKLGRNYIGIENIKEYYDISVKRINETNQINISNQTINELF